MLIQDGIPLTEDLAGVMPPKERLIKGPVAIIECFQQIACNPCTKACPQGAIHMEPDINALPKLDFDACSGCGICVSRCPGLAIFVVDMSYSETEALVMLPFEFYPVPKIGNLVMGLNRRGEILGMFPVVRVASGGKKNKTWVISLSVPKDLAMEIRAIEPGGYQDE